jgi:hypothetical protein
LDAIEVPLSKWGEHAILRATRTDAWYNLMCLLNDRVQESIDEAGLMPFVDMEPAEQCALIEQQYREVHCKVYIFVHIIIYVHACLF